MSLRPRYLLQESILILLLGYLLLLGGTFNGLVLYPLNQMTAIVVGVIGVIWFGARLARRQEIARTPLDAPLLVFLAAYAVATLFSTDPGRSVGYLGLLALYVLAFYLVADLVQAGWPAELFVKSLLVVSLIVLFFGLWEIERWYADWLAIGGLAHPFPPATLRIRAFLGHPNFVAAFLNLLLPLALARMVGSRAWGPRVLLGLWSSVALVLVFFTSSRGGWLGTAAVLAALVCLLALARRDQARQVIRSLLRPRWRLAALALAVILLAGAGAWLLVQQSQHPTHGALLDSRNSIWLAAWQAFVRSPLVGTGPFTYASTFARTNSVPPTMLLAHAHNYALNILTETGLVGEAALILVAVALAAGVWRRWRAAGSEERLFLAGSIASLAGIAVHSCFDTPQTMPTIDLVIVAVLGVTLVGPPATLASSRPRGSLVIVCSVFLAVMVGGGWSLWSYAPFNRGVSATNVGQWRAGAAWLDLAVQRNPRLAFYHFQAGYAHGVLAATATDRRELDAALAGYSAGVALDPNWAANLGNMAALYHQAGQRDEAILWMERAATLAPDEASFRLNLGRYLEEAGDAASAAEAYHRALDIRPTWIDLPFWSQTAVGQQTANAWRAAQPDRAAFANLGASERLLTGWSDLDAGRAGAAQAFFSRALGANDGEAFLGLGEAELALGHLDAAERAVRTALFIEAAPSVHIEALFARGQVARARGDSQAADRFYQAALDQLEQPTSSGPGTLGDSPYGWYVYNRASVAPDLVPQFFYPTLTNRVLARMVELAEWRAQSGDRQSAIQVLHQVLAASPDRTEARRQLDVLLASFP